MVSATTTLPSANSASVTDDTKKMSLVAYDSLGATVQYDYYFTKTGVTTDANGAVTGSTWEVAVYRNGDAATANVPAGAGSNSLRAAVARLGGSTPNATGAVVVDGVGSTLTAAVQLLVGN